MQRQFTTGLYTFCQAFQLYGHFHDDGFCLVNLVEVYVQDVVLYRVELDIFHDGVVLRAIDNQIYHIDVGSINEVAQSFGGHSEVDVLTTSVKHAGNAVVFTNSFQSSCLFRRTFCNGSCSSFYFNRFHV